MTPCKRGRRNYCLVRETVVPSPLLPPFSCTLALWDSQWSIWFQIKVNNPSTDSIVGHFAALPSITTQNKSRRGPLPSLLLCKRIKLWDAVARVCGGEIAPANKVLRSIDLHIGAATQAQMIISSRQLTGLGCHSASQWSRFPLRRRLATKKEVIVLSDFPLPAWGS